jgi:hypothetical protein
MQIAFRGANRKNQIELFIHKFQFNEPVKRLLKFRICLLN